MSFSLTYETVKYVNIKDSRLAILRSILLLAIVLYVGVFEMWGEGGWLEASPVVGVVRFSLQQPTSNNCDPNNDNTCVNEFRPLTELAYCRQSAEIGNETTYPGNVYPCEIYEATNAQIISEKSVAIITRASAREEELVCGQADMVCPRTYNATSAERKFYTAQSEAFTILFDHSVTASKICTARNNYACSSESSKYSGRLLSKNDFLCAQEFARGKSFSDFRGGKPKADAPCYVSPNTTSDHQDFFSLHVLLQAVGVTLDDCSTTGSVPANATCQTYRDTGATLVLNIYWADFHAFRGMVEPFYYYSPQFLAGSSFKQSIPFYHSYRSSRTLLKAHGIRVAVLLGGEYHQFDTVSFLVTLTTALGLLAVATTVVDALMLYILPEKKRYLQAKYEEEGQGERDGALHEGSMLLDVGEGDSVSADARHALARNRDFQDEMTEPLMNTAI
ncbi:ATP P2X receptor [Fragilaria crotonensis]|nr:ATP P2X receptor [Fragilaria crotonensis]